MEMHVAAIDVGSNTIRLLVARVDGAIEPLDSERVRLSLGAEIERNGGVSEVSVAAAAKAVRRLCARARRHSLDALDVFLTAPGRQSANADELLAALSRAAAHPVRVLPTEEEGRLAYAGAIATADVELSRTVAVCDVGGASTEIAIGDPACEPTWIRSVDLGSVRLTARDDHAAEVTSAFATIEPPPVDVALAVGGSARAVRRLVGPWLGQEELAAAWRIVAVTPERTISRRYGVHKSRVGILPAGVELLAELQRRLGVPLHVCSGGIREGAVLESFRARRAA